MGFTWESLAWAPGSAGRQGRRRWHPARQQRVPMPDSVMALPAPSAPRLVPSWECPAEPPAPGEAGLLLLESLPCSTLCQGSDLPSLWPLRSPGAVGWQQSACVLPAAATHLPGVGMAVTLAALEVLGEGWGEDVLPDCSGDNCLAPPSGLPGCVPPPWPYPACGAGTVPGGTAASLSCHRVSLAF